MDDILRRIDAVAAMTQVAPGARGGRVPLDGYRRGCGLQFGNAMQVVGDDPDFRAAYGLARGRTLVEDARLANLFLLVAVYLRALPFGHIVEFGSYRGGSAFFLARLAQKFLPGARVYAFDTFAGMPETDGEIDAHRAGDFADVNLREIRVAAAMAGLTNLHLVAGRFEDTADAALRAAGPVALAHVDCDIASGVAVSYDAVRPHLVPGAYLVFDDPLTSSCLGAFEAVEALLVRRDGLHAEQVYPHLVYRHALPDA